MSNVLVQENVFEVEVTCGETVVVTMPGATGERGTIDIGTTSTVNPDQPAAVENVGTLNDAILNFDIPRGSHVSVGTTSPTTYSTDNPAVSDSGTNGDVVLDFTLPRAPTISVGTTSNVDYGTPAEVVNSGTNGDVVLDFTLQSGPLAKVTELRGRTTLGGATGTVAINITDFNASFDLLHVYINSTYIAQGSDYTISGANIVRSSGTWAVGTVIDFVCLRSILIPIESLPETSGQIKFPATQVSSSDANTLDDYEEGTWTPTIGADSGSGATYSSQIGKYVKIGDLVACECYLKLTSKGTLSGSVYLSSLPFEVDSAKNTASAITASGENLATNLVGIGFQPAFTTNLSGIKNINNTTAISVLTQSDLTNSTGFRLQFFYYAT